MDLRIESIDYTPLINKLEERKLTSYQLEHQWGIPNKTIYNIRQGKIVTIETLAKLAYILDTDIGQLVNFQISVIQNADKYQQKLFMAAVFCV